MRSEMRSEMRSCSLRQARINQAERVNLIAFSVLVAEPTGAASIQESAFRSELLHALTCGPCACGKTDGDAVEMRASIGTRCNVCMHAERMSCISRRINR